MRRSAVIVIIVVIALACRGGTPAASQPRDAGSALPQSGDARPAPPPAAAGDPKLDPALPAAAPCVADETQVAPPSHDQLTLTKAKFTDLPGWADDHVAEAVPSFLRSCERLAALHDGDPVGTDGHGGKARQWRHACAAAAKLTAGDDAAAKKLFESEFTPWVAAGTAGASGKLTGYYVAELHASRKQTGAFKFPVLARPKDLVMIDLSQFMRDAHGRRVWGRVDQKGEVVPYYTRAEIRTGALKGKGLELMYVDDPVDLLFAQIEGSAKAKLDDGSLVWLEFAGKNGRAYRGVGGVLKALGELTPGTGTMQGIRKWFHDHPTRFDEIADQDASYVFFAESPEPGAVGSQKVILTAERSMAVDRAFIAASTPIWVETRAPVPGKKESAPWTHLLIAQDTGAGIVGAVRGDIYWGDDAAAAERGGRMGGSGKYWLLLPNGVSK